MTSIIFGVVVLVLAVGFADRAASLFSIIPIGAVGALLILAGTDLAISRRLFDGKPSCWPVIGVTALATLTINPALGLIVGWIAELVRAMIVRRLVPQKLNHELSLARPYLCPVCLRSAGAHRDPGSSICRTTDPHDKGTVIRRCSDSQGSFRFVEYLADLGRETGKIEGLYD